MSLLKRKPPPAKARARVINLAAARPDYTARPIPVEAAIALMRVRAANPGRNGRKPGR